MSVLIEQSDSVAIIEEPQATSTRGGSTLTRATPFEVTSTACTTTTVTSADLASANLYAYVGNWLQVLDGNCAGEWVQIRSFSGATVATIDPLSSAAPTNAAHFRMFVPPEPIVAATAAAAATTITAAGRAEANEYFDDPDANYAVKIGGPGSIARGESKLVTQYVVGTFTVEGTGFSTTTAAGDHFALRKPVKHAGGEIGVATEQAYIERRFLRGDLELDPGVLGPRSPTANLALEIKGNSAAASGDTVAQRPKEAGSLLKAIFAEDADAASTKASGDTTTIVVAAGDGVNFAVGNLILVNGEATMITGISTDTLTVSPALSVDAIDGCAVIGGCNYKPKTTGFLSHTVEMYRGGEIRHMVYGWLPNLKIEGLASTEIPRFVFEGPADSHMRNAVALPNLAAYPLAYDTTLPRPAWGGTVILGGTRITNCRNITFDAGLTMASKDAVPGAHGRDGVIFTGRKSTGVISLWHEDITEIRRFERGDAMSLLVQVGDVATGAFALCIPAIQYSGAPVGKEGGGYTQDMPFNVVASGTAGLPPFCLATF